MNFDGYHRDGDSDEYDKYSRPAPGAGGGAVGSQGGSHTGIIIAGVAGAEAIAAAVLALNRAPNHKPIVRQWRSRQFYDQRGYHSDGLSVGSAGQRHGCGRGWAESAPQWVRFPRDAGVGCKRFVHLYPSGEFQWDRQLHVSRQRWEVGQQYHDCVYYSGGGQRRPGVDQRHLHFHQKHIVERAGSDRRADE